MNSNKRRFRAVFAPETRFEVTPTPAAPFRAMIETEFDRLGTRLLKDLLNRTESAELNLLYRHAANEAAALASSTGFPLLMLPELFEEKAEAARRYARRQGRILKRSQEMAEAVE